MQIRRSEELLLRWIESAAFGPAVFRTHVGLSISPANSQVYETERCRTHFAIFSKIFAHLKDYRYKLMQEASKSGWPLIRSMSAYCADEECWKVTNQYMFGSDFLIAPTIESVFTSKETNNKQSKERKINK